MLPIRLVPTALLALAVGLVAACGEASPGRGEEGAEPAAGRPSPAVVADPEVHARGGDADPAPDDDWAMLRAAIPDQELDALTGEGLLEGPAGPVPGADTHFPVEGPRGGALFALGEGRGYYEFSHSEHWGVCALYVYDAAMRSRDPDAPPVLNVHCDGASYALTPSRESFDEVEDGGWHFEDDALLGYPDAGRFRLVVDGATYTPPFAHIHVGHGHDHADEHASGPHGHGPGPHKGYVITLGAHLAHLEVVHKPHWGILALYLYDAAMAPREVDAPPILNLVSDGEPHQLAAGRESWDGEEDGGWHFEDDVLLGETEPGRFRVVVDGKTYAPPFTYYRHGEEPGHSHGADGQHDASD